MKRRISAIASVAAVMIVLGAVPASAGTEPNKVVPYVEVTNVAFSQGTDGDTWVDLTFDGQWGDGSWVEMAFSAFVSVDVSNATDSAGLIVQHHDGEWTIAGTYDVGGTTAETSPSLFIIEGDGIRVNMGTSFNADFSFAEDLFFTVQSASMETADSPRIEGSQFAGPVIWSNPNLDPRLRASALMSSPPGVFQAIEEPSIPVLGNPTPADAPADKPAEQPTAPADFAAPSVPLTEDESQALADDIDNRAQDDIPASTDDDGDSNGARNFLIISILIAFSVALGWGLWRRNRSQSEPTGDDKPIDELSNEVPSDDEIEARITAATKDLIEKQGIKLDTAPEKTPSDLPADRPPDLPEDLPTDLP